MIAWNYVLGREIIPHIIKLRVSCYARPLRHNNCSVPFISNSDWVNVCHWNNHAGIFQACSGCHLYHIYFSYYWIPGYARVYWTRVLQVSGLQYVYLGFFRGRGRSLDGNVSKTPLYHYTCFACSFIPFPCGNIPK